ncbi:MAG TPA: Dabb family protein [Clostridiales bacterium]|nr:Dabb family protein [Clostridiales bacterium]
MVKHIVMWKLKKHSDLTHKIAAAMEIKKSLERLTSLIIQIRQLEVGMNFSTSDRAYDIVLYTEFDSKKDLENYSVHPEHVKIKAFIDSIVEDRVIVDYEV